MRFYEIRNYNIKSNLFEVDFNRKDLIQKVMNGPIQCGFEAETIWPNINVDDYDERSGNDIEDELSSRTRDSISERYGDWLADNHTEDYYDTIVEELLSEEDNSDSVREFIDSQDLEDELEEYREEHNEDADETDFVTDQYSTEYYEFLREKIAEKYEVIAMALDRAAEDYSIDDWIDSEYGGSVSRMVSDFGDYLPNSSDDGFEEIAEMLQRRFSREVKTGSYAEHGGSTSPDFWRVEEDTSIEGEGNFGAEIISPVYNSPAEMIEDIKALFELFRENEVYTNRSTGFHITMSLSSESPDKINRVKVATLLGDEYLLKQFNRLNNTYTASQMKKIKLFINDMVRQENPEIAKLDQLEQAIGERGISISKYSSVHFKGLKNDSGNELVEFRIAGGDYLSDMDKINKAIVKYGTVMLAGYDKEMFKKDYLKILAKLVNQGMDPVATRSGEKPKLPKTALVNSVTEFLRLYKAHLSATDVQNMLDLLDEVYSIRENKLQSSAVVAFFTLVSRMARIMVNVQDPKSIKLNSNIILGIRKGFEELGVTYEDYLGWGGNSSKILTPALKKLLGPVADVEEHVLVTRVGYRYLSPRSLVRSMYNGDMNPADVSKIVEISERVYNHLAKLLRDRPAAIASGDDEAVKEIDDYHRLVNSKLGIYIHSPYGMLDDVPPGLKDDDMYVAFALSELRNNGVTLEHI